MAYGDGPLTSSELSRRRKERREERRLYHARVRRGETVPKAPPAYRRNLTYAQRYIDTIARRYGLTYFEYEWLLYAQHYLCAWCDLPLGDDRNVDHDHAIGMGNREAVRGIVHSACNTAIGVFERTTVRKAEAYIQRSRPFAVRNAR